jgi:hypothetical protein
MCLLFCTTTSARQFLHNISCITLLLSTSSATSLDVVQKRPSTHPPLRIESLDVSIFCTSPLGNSSTHLQTSSGNVSRYLLFYTSSHSLCAFIAYYQHSISREELLKMSELHNLVFKYLLDIVQIDAPSWYINPEFPVVLVQEFSSITAAAPIQFAPGLLEVLQSPTPPEDEFFECLPAATSDVWAVYNVTLVKEGFEPVHCVGSATNARNGATTRTNNYFDPEHACCLALFVRLTTMATNCLTSVCFAGLHYLQLLLCLAQDFCSLLLRVPSPVSSSLSCRLSWSLTGPG